MTSAVALLDLDADRAWNGGGLRGDERGAEPAKGSATTPGRLVDNLHEESGRPDDGCPSRLAFRATWWPARNTDSCGGPSTRLHSRRSTRKDRPHGNETSPRPTTWFVPYEAVSRETAAGRPAVRAIRTAAGRSPHLQRGVVAGPGVDVPMRASRSRRPLAGVPTSPTARQVPSSRRVGHQHVGLQVSVRDLQAVPCHRVTDSSA